MSAGYPKISSAARWSIKLLKYFLQEYNDLWISQVDGNESVDFFRTALYIVLDNFTASGYGLKESKSETHLIICTVLMIFGRLFECYLIGIFLI